MADSLDASLVDMRFVKPIDDSTLAAMADAHDLLVTVEENAVHGGAGSAVLEALHARSLQAECLLIGLPDRFIDHGARGDCLAAAGLDAATIEARIRSRMNDLGLDSATPETIAHSGA